MKKTIIAVMSAGLFGLAMSLPAAAEVPLVLAAAPTAKPKPIDWAQVYAKLDLSSAQAQRINEIRELFDKQAKFLKGQIQAKQSQIQGQLNAGGDNPTRLHSLLNEKIALENQLQKAALDSFLAIQKVLTPQQLARLQQELNKNKQPQSGVIR